MQLGLTATPKETKYVSSTAYFGEPVYTYSLKLGIEDGFLAPYKVVRIDIYKDVLGWTPPPGMKDDLGQEIERREYNQKDMDRILVLNQRTKLVARRVVKYLNATDPFAKTIVFCEDIDHGERMRVAIVNAAGRVAIDNPKYVMRITGDSIEGKAELDNFIGPESRFPVIATTSELLTTGVAARIISERIEYLGPDGELITESYKDFSRKQIQSEYASLDDFLRRWNSEKKKQAILDELEERGIVLDNLAAEIGKDYGDFDLICHIAFGQPPLTRKERANRVRKRNYFTKYGDQARAVLDALLDKYADEGIGTLESARVLKLKPFDKIGTPVEIINRIFGGKASYENAIQELEQALFNQDRSA